MAPESGLDPPLTHKSCHCAHGNKACRLRVWESISVSWFPFSGDDSINSHHSPGATNQNEFSHFPGGPVDKNPPANAEDMVQPLVQEDPTCLGAAMPHGPRLLIPSSGTCKLMVLKPMPHNRRSRHNEKPARHS